MIREDKFRISRRPYAVDLSSLTVEGSYVTVRAVWYRRRKGRTVACVGRLWDHQRPAPVDAEEFLRRHGDGRYGGACAGRWDGVGYWGAEKPDVAASHLELLRPMLADFPAAPGGFDGWWRFDG